ncbi:general secretion pathway protein E [Thermodesulfovibrio aggregans]|uniref:General secretion pathway protein E n=1 Tax=Thermodesulfovibrio aggregans TaxID=86166 RepID=A0A0U9HYM0_9BACT|nr:GspE/PulE family protein [Thermodesulfovibrio aggregans]GAQ95301.1 general secretion pathway protein E [Thermodesulfovibrio aggregans]
MRLGDLLLEKKLLTEQELSIALSVQKITGQVLGKCLISLGFITSSELAEILAIQHGLEYIDIRQYPIDTELLKLFPKNVTESAKFLPIEQTDAVLKIVVTDPSNIVALDKVKAITGKRAKPYLTDEEGFMDTLEKAYYFLENPTEKIIEDSINVTLTTGVTPPDSFPRIVDAILAEGIRRGATDIHININAGVVTILYRVDGILTEGYFLPRQLHTGIVSRIKILARLDIAEQRLPQDGSFIFPFVGKRYEVRVSTIPTIDGESVVLRLLFGGSDEFFSLNKLGFSETLAMKLREIIRKPNGIILVVGPTGSGKSTTLYALLRETNRLQRSVITIEDPVEYRISFAKQSEVNEKIGYDFALAGRSFMRHDPDIILLGEIRDEETAKIAIRASVTGHLVLSTLHTSDAVSAVPRLFDLGADRFLLSSSLLAVLSQRLIRKICPFCKTSRDLTEREREIFKNANMEVETVYYGAGCKVCKKTGYLGRVAIGELMIVSDKMRDMIYEGVSFNALKGAAKDSGMIPLKIDGLKKVAEGVSTIEEVERVAG